MLLHAPFAAVKGNDIPQINMKQIFHNFYRFDKQRIPRKLGQIAVVAHIKMKIRLIVPRKAHLLQIIGKPGNFFITGKMCIRDRGRD